MIRTRSAAVLLAVTFSAWAAAATEAGALQAARNPAIAAFEEKLDADVRADGVASIAAGIVIGTDVVWAKAFGSRDRDRGLPADAATIYRIGSISKSVTAALMMALAQRGVLSPDDAVVKYLPEFRSLGGGVPEAERITLRQLASHTGGLIREPQLEGAAAGPIAQWEEKILASIPATSLSSPPGTRYSYSNIGYGILGLALSRAANEPFMDMVQRLVFAPLGMISSTFIITQPLAERLSAGYQNGRDGRIDAGLAAREHAGRGYKVPNGGVYSTVHDLARFIALMTGALGDDVLSASTRAEMLKPQTPGPGGNGYGLGFNLRTTADGVTLVSHGGSVAGYTAHIVFDPATSIGVILLRNYASGATSLVSAAEAALLALRSSLPQPLRVREAA